MLTDKQLKILKINSIINNLYNLRLVLKPFEHYSYLFNQIRIINNQAHEIMEWYDFTLKGYLHDLFYSQPFDTKDQIKAIDKLIDYFIAEKYKQGDAFYKAD